MKSYLLQIDGRQEGPYRDTQVAQLFAQRRVSQHTPCKLEQLAEWRTIDDFLPTLKYGTELPAAETVTRATVRSGVLPPLPPGTAVKITDVDVPFTSVLKMAFKIVGAWLIVGACLAPVALIIWFVLFAWILGVFAHLPH